MSTYRYTIIIKTQKGFLTMKYKSAEKIEIGEELLVFYEGGNHLICVTSITKRLTLEAEEI